MHLFYIPNELTNAYFGAVTLLAWWKGDWRARAITTCQIAIIAVGYYCTYGPCRRVGHQWAQWFAEDIVLLAVCVACALRAQRYWPIWASSCALLVLVTDVLMFVDPRITAWADLAASYVWRILLSGAVLSGVWPAVRARLFPPQPRQPG